LHFHPNWQTVNPVCEIGAKGVSKREQLMTQEPNLLLIDTALGGPSTRAERGAATRRRILEAAVESLWSNGYAGTSTVLVAEVARVSRGAMLHHFASKAILMAAVVQHTFGEDVAHYKSVLDPTGGAMERAERLIDAAWERFQMPSAIAQIEIWMASRADTELAAAVLPIYHEIDRVAHEGHIELFKGFGITREEDILSFRMLTLATVRGLALEATLAHGSRELTPAVELLKRSFTHMVETLLLRATKGAL
jgi:AcrR family transcriptional regulator